MPLCENASLLLLLLLSPSAAPIWAVGAAEQEHIVVAAIPSPGDSTASQCVSNCFSTDGLASSSGPPWRLEPLTVVGNLTGSNGTFAFLMPDGSGGLLQGGQFSKVDLPDTSAKSGTHRTNNGWNSTGLLIHWDSHTETAVADGGGEKQWAHWRSMLGLVGIVATGATLDTSEDPPRSIVGGIFSQAVSNMGQTKQLFNMASCETAGNDSEGKCGPFYLAGSNAYLKGPQLSGFANTLAFSNVSRMLWGVYNDFARTNGAFLNTVVAWGTGKTTATPMLRQATPPSGANVSSCCGFDITQDSSPFIDPWLVVDPDGNAVVVASAGMEFELANPMVVGWCPGSEGISNPEHSVIYSYSVKERCWNVTLQDAPQSLPSCVRLGDVNPIDPSQMITVGTQCRDYGKTALFRSSLSRGVWSSSPIEPPRPFTFMDLKAWGAALYPRRWFALGTGSGELFVADSTSPNLTWQAVCSPGGQQSECSDLMANFSGDGGQLIATWDQSDGGEVVVNPNSPRSGAMRVSWRTTGVPAPIPVQALRENVTARPNIVDFWGTGRSLAVLTTEQDLYTNRSCLVWQPIQGTSRPWFAVDNVAFVSVNDENMFIGYSDGKNVLVKKFGSGVEKREGVVVAPPLPCVGPNSGSFGGATDEKGNLFVVCSSYDPDVWTLFVYYKGANNWTSVLTGPGACHGDGWVVYVPSSFGDGYLAFMCTDFVAPTPPSGNLLMPFNLSALVNEMVLPPIIMTQNRTIFGMTYIPATETCGLHDILYIGGDSEILQWVPGALALSPWMTFRGNFPVQGQVFSMTCSLRYKKLFFVVEKSGEDETTDCYPAGEPFCNQLYVVDPIEPGNIPQLIMGSQVQAVTRGSWPPPLIKLAPVHRSSEGSTRSRDEIIVLTTILVVTAFVVAGLTGYVIYTKRKSPPSAVEGGDFHNEVVVVVKEQEPRPALARRLVDSGETTELLSGISELASESQAKIRRGQLLGRGAYGSVYKCRLVGSKGWFAIKVVSIGNINDEKRRAALRISFRDEVLMLRRLGNCPYVVQFVGALESERHLGIIMELLDFTLTKLMQNRERNEAALGWFDQDDCLRFIHDIAAGTAFLHSHRIAHRDLKSENVLVEMGDYHGKVNRLVLADFGVSKTFEAVGGHTESIVAAAETLVGTPAYMAPEIFRAVPGDGYDPLRSDIYSIGVMCYEVLVGSVPSTNRGQILSLPTDHGSVVGRRVARYNHLSLLFMRCTELDPRQRPKAEELVQELQPFANPVGEWSDAGKIL